MSLYAILNACRDQLREVVPLSDAECDITPEGRPLPGFGDRFVSIHPTRWDRNIRGVGDVMMGLMEGYAVDVTITRRAPSSRPGKALVNLYLEGIKSMEKLARKIMIAIHHNEVLLQAINDYIDDDEEPVFSALEWVSTDASPQFVGADWVWSDNPTDTERAAMTLTVHFDHAERGQAEDSMA